MCIYRTDRAANGCRACCNFNVHAANNVATRKYIQVKTKQKIKAKTREYSGEWTGSPGAFHRDRLSVSLMKYAANKQEINADIRKNSL